MFRKSSNQLSPVFYDGGRGSQDSDRHSGKESEVGDLNPNTSPQVMGRVQLDWKTGLTRLPPHREAIRGDLDAPRPHMQSAKHSQCNWPVDAATHTWVWSGGAAEEGADRTHMAHRFL